MSGKRRAKRRKREKRGYSVRRAWRTSFGRGKHGKVEDQERRNEIKKSFARGKAEIA